MKILTKWLRNGNDKLSNESSLYSFQRLLFTNLHSNVTSQAHTILPGWSFLSCSAISDLFQFYPSIFSVPSLGSFFCHLISLYTFQILPKTISRITFTNKPVFYFWINQKLIPSQAAYNVPLYASFFHSQRKKPTIK